MLIEMTDKQTAAAIAGLRFLAKQAEKAGDKDSAWMLRRYATDIEDQRAGEPSNFRFL